MTCNLKEQRRSTIRCGHVWIRIIPCGDRDDEVYNLHITSVSLLFSGIINKLPLVGTYHQKSSLEVIRLPVTQEIANDQDGEDEEGDHEDLKVEIHGFVQGPADEDDEGGVEEGGLDGGAETVVECKVLVSIG